MSGALASETGRAIPGETYTMRYLPTPCNCAECRANRRRNARLTMRLAPLLVATAVLVGWLILRSK